MHSELMRALEKAGSPSVLVVGDLMLDRYVWGEVDRISPEAPVPVVQVDSSRTHQTVGGAGSVVRDLVALGAHVIAAGFVGGDAEGQKIIDTLKADGVDTSLVVVDQARPTTQKMRVIASSHHLLRIDSEDSRPLERQVASQMLAGISAAISKVDAVILSDYNKGVLDAESVSCIVRAARQERKQVWADPARGRDFAVFRGVTAVTPNRRETEDATGLRIPHGTTPKEAAEKLALLMDLEVAVITLDREGLYYRTSDGREETITSRPRAAYDVTGAGDMVIAAAVFGVASGMSLRTALTFANFAAGMEVERIGVAPIKRAEMLRRLRDEANIASEKLLSRQELAHALDERRRRGESVVFTNGCFDILHAGHAKFLQFARAQGDLLVVGLNSDKSVKAMKGESRPIVQERERASLLAALSCVDYVVLFDEDTPAALISAVLPDILVKGEDWRERGVVGRETVEARGGKVVLAPLVEGLSTTAVVKRILDANAGGKRDE